MRVYVVFTTNQPLGVYSDYEAATRMADDLQKMSGNRILHFVQGFDLIRENKHETLLRQDERS